MKNTCLGFIKAVSIFILLQPLNSLAQTFDSDTTASFVEENFQISGEVGTYGELYSMTGAEKRRPSSTGRIFLRPTITLFNLLNIPFEFLISTEGSSARQNLNQFGITPEWEWGRAGLGDFTETYSEHTLNGIQLRGAGINIFPGIFRFAIASGFTRRAVEGGALNGSFERFMFASKIGIGKEDESFIDLILVKAKDKVGSLDKPINSIKVLFPNGDDQIPIGSIQTIRWSSVGLPGNVKIEISRDGGNTFEVLFPDIANSGFADWTVTGAPSYSTLIKITSLVDTTISDISDFSFIIDNGIDFIEGSIYESAENAYAVTPQENLVVGLNSKLSLLENKINIKIETGGSAFTRDLRSKDEDIDSTDLPAFLNEIYKIKKSTNVDYFINTSAGLNLDNISAKVGYKRIGPGYKSLGLPYLINDQQEISASTNFRIDQYGINLNYMHINDNLLDQKLFTTSRNQFGVNANGILSTFWNSSILFNFLNMNNDSENDTSKVDFSNLIIGMNNSFTLQNIMFLKNILLNYTYQQSNNKSVLISNGKSISHSLNVNFMFMISPTISASAGAGLVKSTYADTTKTTINTYLISARHRAFENKLNSMLSLNVSNQEKNTTFRISFNTSYSISTMDRISLTISSMKYNGSGLRKSFTELMGSISYSHRI